MNKSKTLLFLAILFIAQISCKQEIEEEKPNILFIMVDDLRPELGAFGVTHIQSPNIDKLASESAIFERAYCNVPVCGASRASLLSGVRPGRNRFVGYNTRLHEDLPGSVTLPQLFKQNGYKTISNGKIFHHKDDSPLSWDEVWRGEKKSPTDYATLVNIELDSDGVKPRGEPYEKADVPDNTYLDGKLADKGMADLERLKKDGKPFFLALGFLKPHLPFNAPTKYWDLYDSTQINLPANYSQPESTPNEAFHNFGELRHYANVPSKGPVSDEMANKLIHGYYACVSYTDAQIGKILDKLEELDLAKNTIVVLVGDHGWNLGDHAMWCKHCNFESSLHTPLLIKVPGKTSGERKQDIVEFIDIYPSLTQLANLEPPAILDGKSLTPALDGITLSRDFAISKFHDGLTLIQGNYFYTEYRDEKDSLLANMLFDHADDPLEMNNLANHVDQAERVQKMSETLLSNRGERFFEDVRVMK